MKTEHDYFSDSGTKYRLRVVETDKGKKIKVYKGNSFEYTITKDWCSCKGWQYHRKCHHMTQAVEHGMVAQLPDVVKKNAKSATIEDSRRNAVETYGKQHGWSKDLIEWTLLRQGEFIKQNKSLDDMLAVYKQEKKTTNKRSK